MRLQKSTCRNSPEALNPGVTAQIKPQKTSWHHGNSLPDHIDPVSEPAMLVIDVGTLCGGHRKAAMTEAD